MDTKKLKKHEIIASLRKMNRELLEENEQLRRQITVLEELAIDAKKHYNISPVKEECYQNDFDFTLGDINE